MKSLLWVMFAIALFAGLAIADECLLCKMTENGNLSEVKHLLSNGE